MKNLSSTVLTLALVSASPVWAQTANPGPKRASAPRSMLETLLGGEARTIHLARTAYQERRFGEAARLFEQAVSDVPRRRPELLPEYADALNAAGRSREAAPLFKEMMAKAPNEVSRKNLAQKLGIALTNSRQYAAALDVYGNLTARYPGNAEMALRRASLLSSLGQADAAVAALNRIAPSAWAMGDAGAMGDTVLINAAAFKAKAGQPAAARQLYERAFAHNGRLRAVYQREFAALVAPDRPAKSFAAAPADGATASRRDLANATPGSSTFLRLQKQLAESLTRENRTLQAIGAWDDYLRYAPGDTGAQIARARLYDRTGQADRARSAFAAAYSRNPANAEARSGLLGATLTLARRAAQQSRNDESRVLFAAATKIDGGRDGDVLREYADQLTFSGRPEEAIPLYLNVLANPEISPLNRRRAMTALADAYSWSDRLGDALQVYTDLLAAEPGNTSLLWSQLVCEARLNARSDKNAQSAGLFAKAIALAPTRRQEILPEYADQLSFMGQAADAIPLYQSVLAQPELTDKARLDTQMGLAQAYEWAGRHDEAKGIYANLIAASPQDIGLQWRMFVVSARGAAMHDRNAQAASLFAKAIQLSPERSKGILAEYADQLSFTGRSNWALTFYKAALDQPGLNEKQKTSIYLAQARSFEWTDNYVAAQGIYDSLAKKNPADQTLKWRSMLAAAREAGRTDQNDKAAKLFADAIKLFPTRRMDVLKEYADKLTYSDQAKQAIPLYRELLLQSTTPAQQKSYNASLALALAWDQQLGAALEVYQQLAVADPADFSARIGSGQMLSWMGRRAEARVEYQKVLEIAPTNAIALRGLAQVEDWDGRHMAAQVLLRQRLDQDGNDMEARKMLAQSLFWSGRSEAAIGELDRALTARADIRKVPSPYALRVSQPVMNEKIQEFPR